jgi:hypothetical protein
LVEFIPIQLHIWSLLAVVVEALETALAVAVVAVI